MITRAQICAKIAPSVMNGLAPTNQTVIDTANRIQQRLLVRGNWYDTQRLIRLRCKNNTVPLPRFVDTVIATATNGMSQGPVFGFGYEFMDHGPGEQAPMSETYCGMPLKDIGYSPVMFDIPWDTPQYIIAVSDQAADVGSSMKVWASTSNKNEVRSVDDDAYLPYFELPILNWINGEEGRLAGADLVSANMSPVKVQEIHSLQKGITKGYICLYAVDPAIVADPALLNTAAYKYLHPLWFLGKYHPNDLIPEFRRYRLLNKSTRNWTRVHMWCKLRHVDMLRDDDLALLRSLDAYVYEAMAIRLEDAGDLAGAQQHKAAAINELQAWHSHQATPDRTIQWEESYANGSRMSLE